MAVRGAVAKAEITNKILETFSGSFKYDKEIRIPVFENGERIEIKVTLTAAKTNVGESTESESSVETKVSIAPEKVQREPTEEEINNIRKLSESLFG